MKVTVIGAAGSVGAPAAFYIGVSGLGRRAGAHRHAAQRRAAARPGYEHGHVRTGREGRRPAATRISQAPTWSSTPPACRRASSPTAWRCCPRTSPWCATWLWRSSSTAPTPSSSPPPTPSTRSTTARGGPAGSTATRSSAIPGTTPPVSGRSSPGPRGSRPARSRPRSSGSTAAPRCRCSAPPASTATRSCSPKTRSRPSAPRSPPSSGATRSCSRAARPVGRAPWGWRPSPGPCCRTRARCFPARWCSTASTARDGSACRCR